MLVKQAEWHRGSSEIGSCILGFVWRRLGKYYCLADRGALSTQ